MACVDDTTILAYFRGELPEQEVAVIAEELDRCESCRELMMAVASAWRSDEGALGDTRRPGTKVGRYVIDRVLGAGAMGVVYAARDPELDREIALKVMARPSPQVAERFRREAQAMARLDHRNVVPIYDVGGEGPEAFVAMALIRGVTLREWLKAGRSLPEIVGAFAQAAEGLAEAHRRGIVHRDFKPENVLAGDDGVIRVGDFGLAQLGAPVALAAGTPGEGSDSAATAGAGTPAYLAPEVRAGRASGPKADQYSFWVALHEAITGERPRDAPSPVASRRLARALARGLAEDPDARFPSMDVVAAELRAIASARKRRTTAIAAAAALAVIGGGAGALAWYARGGGDGNRCARAGAALDAQWSPARAAEVRAAITRSPKPYAPFAADAVVERLDHYAAAWRSSATAACRAAHVEHTQSTDLLDRRTACLADRRAALAAVLERVPAAPADAIDLVDALPAIAVCDDVATLVHEPVPPREPIAVQQLATVRAQIARAKTSFATGTFDDGVKIARAAVAAARTTAHRPLIAEALEVYGGLLSSSGKPEDALAILDEALRDAEASQATYAALAIRLRESEVLGALGKHDEALRVARLGLATAESAGVAKLAADFHVEIGVLESDVGHNEVALAAYREGLAIYEREQGPDGVEVGHVSGLIGLVEDDLGQHEQAIRDIQRALDVAGRVYGKAHPNYANALSNLSSHVYSDDPQRALELAQQAHAIRLAALDPDHPELAMSWSNLGGILRSLGKLPEARDALEKALVLKKKVLGADHPSVGVTHVNLAQTLFDLHDLQGSLDHAQQAVAVLAPALGDGHVYTATARAHLRVTLLELGRAAEAVAPLTDAIAHLPQDSDLYRFQFDLAEALAKSHGDRAKSRALATTALAAATQRGDKVAIAAIQKFLRAR